MAGQARLSQCADCRHWRGGTKCAAFPERIPGTILRNEHDHREPYEGDNGIRFEPVEGRSDEGGR